MYYQFTVVALWAIVANDLRFLGSERNDGEEASLKHIDEKLTLESPIETHPWESKKLFKIIIVKMHFYVNDKLCYQQRGSRIDRGGGRGGSIECP